MTDASGFQPAPGLANPHMQTIAGKLLRPEMDVPLRFWVEEVVADFIAGRLLGGH